MKVLFLTNHDVVHFGVAEILNGLSAALSGQGIDVVTYTADPSGQLPPPSPPCQEGARGGGGRLPNGLPCHWAALPKPRIFQTRRAFDPLVRFCRTQGIDLIHCHGLYRPGWAAMGVQRAAGIPYVVTSHGDINQVASPRMQRFWVRRRARAILQAAAAVTHNNRFMADNAQAISDVRGKSFLIPNGVDLAWWAKPCRPVPGKYVLALGRLVPTKGFAVLVEAWPMLAQRGVGVALVLAGTGPDQAALEKRARALGLPVCHRLHSLDAARPNAVCFPGLVRGDDKRALFASSTLVVFPSQPESPEAFPLVLVEALAAGKALVASDLACVREILSSENALRVPPASAKNWADALERLVRNEGLRGQMETANAAKARQFSWPEIARQYARVYDQALAVTRSFSSPSGKGVGVRESRKAG